MFSIDGDKSWKRELAIAAILFWMGISVRIFWFLSPDNVRAFDGAYSMVTMTVWAYAAAAFGLHTMMPVLQQRIGHGRRKAT